MSLPQKNARCTPEEYLEFERQAETRHEYLDGLVYEMAGESLAHSQICVNLAGELRAQLKGKPCQALSPNMKVRTGESGLFAYPDLTIVCGEPLFHDRQRDVLLNPTVIFEALSPSTERYDRGKKFMKYSSTIETLTEYILVSQDMPLLEYLERQADGRWLHTFVRGLTEKLYLASIDCEVRLSEVYDRVEFPLEEIGQPLDISTA
ncbi:MAG TPA: Uma2 family endonuclease [Pyrinomonadaceae bacterium]|nr:Uma2 family endonuclease [Pyrinomonadaceae bacterium]